MASLHLLKFGRHCVPGIPNDTFLVPVPRGHSARSRGHALKS